MKIATNINWDIDMAEAYERLDDMTVQEAAKALEISDDRYANMTTEERHDFAYDLWHHSPATLDEFMELPDEVAIPACFNETDDFYADDVADWLSDTYGFCHEGFELAEVEV